MRYIIALLVLAALAVVAGATDGYYQKGNYYYYGSEPQAYYRNLVTIPGYWSCGRYFPQYSYYSYTAYTPPIAQVPYQAPTYTPGDWKTQLLKIAEQRDKYEGQIRQAALDQQYYLQSIQALGLSGNFNWQGYGTIPGYVLSQAQMPYALQGHYYQNQTPPYGASASTVYQARSYSDAAKLYGDDYMPGLYQMASQHTINSQTVMDKAQAGFMELVGREGMHKAKVAQILATGQVMVAMLRALDGPPSALQQGFSFKIGPGVIEPNADKVDPAVKEQLAVQFRDLVKQECLGCHSGTAKKGGLDMSLYSTFTPQRKQEVWNRLITTDSDKMMPRDPKGGPGKRLPDSQLRLFGLH